MITITDLDDLIERYCIMTVDGKLKDKDALEILEDQTSKNLMNSLIDKILGGIIL